MNTQNFPDHDLTEHLARRADDFGRRGGSELEIGQVLARAGEIRRGRRMRASMLMAAAVLAVAVPTALVSVGDGGSNDTAPLPAGEVDASSIGLDGLAAGAAPAIGYLSDGRWHSADGTIDLSGLPGRIGEVAPIEGGLLVAVQDEETGALTARFVDADGRTGGEARPMDWGFAVSPGGKVGAFVQPDGTPVVVQDGGATTLELPKVPKGSGFEAREVVGEDCEPADGEPACAVWVESNGEQPETWGSTPDRVSVSDLDLSNVVISVEQGLVGGITEVRDDTSTCSEVARFDGGSALWSTCDHRFHSFSPDGEHLLAAGSIGDGLGDTQLAFLDSSTGKVVLDLITTPTAHVNRAVWEDDTHVLASVYDGGRWALVRIGIDGQREYAVAPVPGEDVDAPFVLPTS